VKGKSSHDLLNDSTLSSLPAVDADDEDECNYTVQVTLLLRTLEKACSGSTFSQYERPHDPFLSLHSTD